MLTTINPSNLTISLEQWLALGPHIILTVGAMLALLVATINSPFTSAPRLPVMLVTLVTLVSAMVWQGMYWTHAPLSIFNGMFAADYFSSFFNMLFLGAALLVVIGSYSYLEREGIHYSEFYSLVLLSTLGMLCLASTVEFISLFVALELMSLAVYVLVGLRRRDRFSNEAAVKYFVMGGVSAAIFLYGVALVYGATGTTKFSALTSWLARDGAVLTANPILVFGLVLVAVGFFFKVAAVPFHMWTPDVYEGAPLLVTSYMSTALKAAVFASFVRFAAAVWGDQGVLRMGNLQGVFHDAVWWMALLTMIVGNTVALWQKNLKRMLAYSSIAHTGYLLVGLLAGVKSGYGPMALYLVAYVAMNIGAFGILAMFSGSADKDATLDHLTGLGQRHPWAAAGLTIFLLSLGGLPPTAGFVGKYYMFMGALEAGETLLVLIAVLTSVISLYYYLRIVVQMYMHQGGEAFRRQASVLGALAVIFCLAVTLHLGMFPGQILSSVKKVANFQTAKAE